MQVCLSIHPSSGTQALLDILSTSHPRDIRELFSKQMAANWRHLALGLGMELYVCENISKRTLQWVWGGLLGNAPLLPNGEHGTGKRERTWGTLLAVAQQVGHGLLHGEQLEKGTLQSIIIGILNFHLRLCKFYCWMPHDSHFHLSVAHLICRYTSFWFYFIQLCDQQCLHISSVPMTV